MERSIAAELKRHYDAIHSQELFHNHDFEPCFRSANNVIANNVIFATVRAWVSKEEYTRYCAAFPTGIRCILDNIGGIAVEVEIILDSSKQYQSAELYNLICTNGMNQRFATHAKDVLKSMQCSVRHTMSDARFMYLMDVVVIKVKTPEGTYCRCIKDRFNKFYLKYGDTSYFDPAVHARTINPDDAFVAEMSKTYKTFDKEYRENDVNILK